MSNSDISFLFLMQGYIGGMDQELLINKISDCEKETVLCDRWAGCCACSRIEKEVRKLEQQVTKPAIRQ